MKVCKIVHVSGKVQGVFFRASTQQQAIELGISGYAKNLTDGDVEVLACGEPEVLEQLLTWLHNGPSNADVSGVKVTEVVWQEHPYFAIA